jgi:hypothetical protein
MKKINIVLHEPEIPQNTGNIARTCAATGAALHIIKPMGFTIDDKKLKRAGLDYWDKLEIEEHSSLEEFLNKYKPEENNMFFATTKGKTKSDDLAECLYDAAKEVLKNKKIRTNNSDGDSDLESDFYIIKHSKCPAVLTENFFMDCMEDKEYLLSEEGKQNITDIHINGILKYIKKHLN